MKDLLQNIEDNATNAISWILDNKKNEAELENESNELLTGLSRLVNSANATKEVYQKPNTIGVFGASQVGKSYLVSSIAADNRHLTTTFDGIDVDFIKIINPAGNDKESTGVVTRFTHTFENNCPKNYPIKVKIFKEIEVVMCLVNTYFQDFEETKQENPNDDIFRDEQVLFERLDKIHQEYLATDKDSCFVTTADVVLLADYVKKISKGCLHKLDATSSFWSRLRTYLPELSLEGRKKIYSLLWGKIKAFDTLFNVIVRELVRLKGVSNIFISLDAFAKLDTETNEYKQEDCTINNVKSIEHLFSGDLKTINVALDVLGKDIVEVNVSPIAFLSLELLFPLSSESKLGSFDVLDFPGARAREYGKLAEYIQNEGCIGEFSVSIDKIESSLCSSARRGKISYLFDRYNERHEFDIMLFCVKGSSQSDVKEIGPLVDGWVSENIGSTPIKRAKFDKIPLVGVITRFDECISNGIGEATGINGAKDIVKDALREFKVQSWLTNWSNGNNFKQFFLARKPNLLYNEKWISLDKNNVEISIKEEQNDYLKKFRDDFLSDLNTKYLFDKEKCFDEVLRLNDGGATYLINFICENFGTTSLKESRIRKLLRVTSLLNSLYLKLIKYASLDGDQKTEKIKTIYNKIKNELMQCHAVSKILYIIREKMTFNIKELTNLYENKYRNSAQIFAEEVVKSWENKLDSICLGPDFEELYIIINNDWNNLVEGLDLSKAETFSLFYLSEEKRFISTNSYFIKLNQERIIFDDKNILRNRLKELLTLFTDQLKIAARSHEMNLIESINCKLAETEQRDALNEDYKDRRVSLVERILADYNCYLTTNVYQKTIKLENNPIFGYDINENLLGLPKIDDEYIDNYDVHYYNSFWNALENIMINVNSKSQNKYNFSNEANAMLCSIVNSLKKATEDKRLVP
ncbi:MAG: virulence factor SrfC family protein [Succinivibrionaceae bacterium]